MSTTLSRPLANAASEASASPVTVFADSFRVRAAAMLALLLCCTAGILGLAWDEQWHQAVGRDAFLTPPHILLYSATGVAGLLCLGIVLQQTWAYRRAAHRSMDVEVFRFFHAPLGVVVAGFGALVTALAAPLDNYWHELYGVDVALWAPFHMMGMLGGFVRISGVLYLICSLLVMRPHSRWLRAALMYDVAILIWTFINVANPGELLFPTFDLGALQVMSYPLVLGLLLPAPLLLVQRLGVLRGWSATVAAATILALGTVLAVYTPWAVQTGAVLEGLSYRSPALAPQFNPAALVPVVAVLVIALFADMAGSRFQPLALGAIMGLALWASGAAIAHVLSTSLAAELASGLSLPPGVHIPPPASWPAILLALPLTVIVASLSAGLGAGWAEFLRRNPRSIAWP